MKFSQKLLSLLIVFSLTAALLPASMRQASAVSASITDDGNGTIIVSDPDSKNGDSLRDALKMAKDGYTIRIMDIGMVNCVSDGGTALNDPWVIDKAVTIEGASGAVASLRVCGIVLGADVTFRNFQFHIPSPVRNCIMANGHKLTLENITVDTYTSQQLHLFCGGPVGNSISGLTPIPSLGSCGEILIKGSTSMGNIYAGNISIDGTDNRLSIPSVITIDSSATGTMGAVYASGALQTPYTGNWFGDVLNGVKIDPPRAAPAHYSTEGDVAIHLSGSVVKTVDGNTGGKKNAAVTFSSPAFFQCELSLQNISSLSVQSGSLCPTALSGEGMDLSISDSGDLRLAGTPDLPTFGRFFGGNSETGGKLVLSNAQTMHISGAVSGTTRLFTGWETSESTSGATLIEGHSYIIAPLSQDGSAFQHVPSASEHLSLTWQAGYWTAAAEGEPISPLLTQFHLPATATYPSGQESLEFPMEPVFLDNGAFLCYLDFIPLEIKVNHTSAVRTEDSDGYFTYAFPSGQLTMEIIEDCLYIYGADLSTPVPDGIYSISVSVPEKYSAKGTPLTVSMVLTIGDDLTAVHPRCQLEPLSVKTSDGQSLSAIPEGDFTVTVSMSGDTAAGQALVLLSAYSESNQLLTSQWSIIACPGSGETASLDFACFNSGEIAFMKAFVLSSDHPLLPLSEAAVFPAG